MLTEKICRVDGNKISYIHEGGMLGNLFSINDQLHAVGLRIDSTGQLIRSI